MSRPILPPEWQAKLPDDIIRLINTYIPKFPKAKPASPGLQKALETLQKSPKRGAMDLYGLDDFVLK